MTTYKILVIDDAFFIRNLIKKAVMRKPIKNDINFEIIGEAQNGNEGLNLVKELNPDIITLDFNIPELNGLDFAKYLKEINPKIPILMISSNTDPTFPQQVEEIGCNFLPKPFQESFLWMRLDALVEEIKNFDESSIQPKVSKETKSLLEEISMEVEAELEENQIELEEVSLPKPNKTELLNENNPNKKKKKKKKKSTDLFGLEIDNSIIIKPKIEENTVISNEVEKSKKIEIKPIISTIKEDDLDFIKKESVKIKNNKESINTPVKKEKLDTFIKENDTLDIDKNALKDNKELDIKEITESIYIKDNSLKNNIQEDIIEFDEDEIVIEDDNQSIIDDEDEIVIEDDNQPIIIDDEDDVVIEDDNQQIIIDDEDDVVIVIDDDNEIIIEDESNSKELQYDEFDTDNSNDSIIEDLDDLEILDETFILDDESIEDISKEKKKEECLSEQELIIKSLKENVSYSYQNEMSYVIHVIEKLTNNKVKNTMEENTELDENNKTNNLGIIAPVIREEDLTKEDEDAEFDKLFAEFNPNLDLSNVTKVEEKMHEQVKESLLEQSPSITQSISIEPPKSEKVRQIYRNGKQDDEQFVIPIEEKPKKTSIFTKIFNLFDRR